MRFAHGALCWTARVLRTMGRAQGFMFCSRSASPPMERRFASSWLWFLLHRFLFFTFCQRALGTRNIMNSARTNIRTGFPLPVIEKASEHSHELAKPRSIVPQARGTNNTSHQPAKRRLIVPKARETKYKLPPQGAGRLFGVPM